jgi:hypothetical protein
VPLAVRLKKGVMGARMRCCDAIGGETRCGGVKPKAGGDRLILKGTRRHGAVGGGGRCVRHTAEGWEGPSQTGRRRAADKARPRCSQAARGTSEQGRWDVDAWAHYTVWGGGSNRFELDLKFKRIQNLLNPFKL